MKHTKESAAKRLGLTIEETPTSLKVITDSGVELCVDEVESNIAMHRLALDEMAKAPVGMASGAQWHHFQHLEAWAVVKDLFETEGK